MYDQSFTRWFWKYHWFVNSDGDATFHWVRTSQTSVNAGAFDLSALWMSCPCAPPPAQPHRCLLFPWCNWDAETLTELIYCDGELCNVEGNTDYYINAHTHTHKEAGRHTHVSKTECNLAPCLKSLFNCSARICTCGLMKPRRQRWTEVKTCWVIASYTVGSVWVCAQVFIMRITHQYCCEGLAIEMGLLCCPVLSLYQQITRLNKKMTKNLQGLSMSEYGEISRVVFLSLSNITLPILPASGWQRRWFILLRQRTSLTHMRTHSQTHTHTGTHIHKSTEVCCHTPLINSYLSAGSPYRIGPPKGDSFPMTDKGSLGDTEDP